MGRFRSGGLRLAVAILSLWSFAGCGGSSKAGSPLYPGRINLTPAVNTSLVLGGAIAFSATAQTTTGTTLRVPISYTSSDTSIVNVSPNGVACAGHWDITFSICSAGNVGVATVTASALGANSVSTYVFVHPAIDNITVTGILLTGIPVQEPCLSQTQSMTLEAHAFSQGTDITASVGPFTWTANNPSVVNIVPLPNTTYNPSIGGTFNFATNEATATAVQPGITYIYASAGGVSSTSFQQPLYADSAGTNSPALDFFATCADSKHQPRGRPRWVWTNQLSHLQGNRADDHCNSHRRNGKQLAAQHRRGSRSEQSSADLDFFLTRRLTGRHDLYAILQHQSGIARISHRHGFLHSANVQRRLPHYSCESCYHQPDQDMHAVFPSAISAVCRLSTAHSISGLRVACLSGSTLNSHPFDSGHGRDFRRSHRCAFHRVRSGGQHRMRPAIARGLHHLHVLRFDCESDGG